MFSRGLRLIIALSVGLLCAAAFSLVVAQPDNPPAAADQIQQQLFQAQSSVMDKDSAAAKTALNQALDLYQTALAPAFDKTAPEVGTALDTAFQQASQDVQSGDVLALAAARGLIWARMMQGSALMVFDALQNNDGKTAHQWILLRDFRTSTKFSRPGADATLAIQAVLDGKSTGTAALQAAQNDLYDTYQAQLTRSLADADTATTKNSPIRRAEEIGLAQGYFEILASVYSQQLGNTALKTARASFEAATSAAVSSDDTAYQSARQQIEAALKGFRAAPLSAAEQARRAGQILRFLSLVPLEYGRGVSGGVVIKDIEVQEALTFQQGASEAFTDLQTVLDKRDPALTASVETLLKQIVDQIHNTVDPSALQSTIDQINTQLTTLFPQEWQSVNNDSDVDVINSVLDQVQTAVAGGQYASAETARLEAYAQLELGIEQRLRGFAPDKAAALESLFWSGSAEQPGLAVLLSTQAAPAVVKTQITAVKAALADAQAFLSSDQVAPEAVVGNAGIIVFREGLEAVLILASLLASLRTAEESQYRRPIVLGAIIAFIATGVTWWFANQILVSMMQLGERLEAVVSLIAIGVLLLITNWFFHKVYWTGWIANFHSRKRDLLTGANVITLGQLIGLIILGFTSIYREGFETVLFLQSLVLEAGIGMVFRGVALGLLATAVVGFFTFKMQKRLPYKRMLIVTGVMIGAVLLIMVGNTVHVMQAVGWLPITTIPRLPLPFWMGQWFGTYSTIQGLGLQAAAAIFVIGSYFWANYAHGKNIPKRDLNRTTTVSNIEQ